MMANLVLGPMQRGLDPRHLRVWVETDQPCAVEVLGRESHTWAVAGHHYGLVELDDLPPGTDEVLEVRLDGELVWPQGGDRYPPARIRTWDGAEPIRLVVGSCRQAAPPSWLDHEESEEDPPGIGTDALAALAEAVIAGEREQLHGLLLLGDQVYADQPDPRTIHAIRERRGRPPRDGWPEVASFEEYTWLYQEAWSEPEIRWLLAAVPSVMVFDDHDVIDDWNISSRWRRSIEQQPWWTGRIEGGLMAYWIYQHLGNVGGREVQDFDLLEQVRSADDGAAVLRDFARRADTGTPDDVGHRWSYAHEIGGARLVVADSRNGRRMEEGERSMLGEAEWAWLQHQLTGGVDHLLFGSSLPWLLPRSMHDLETWVEHLTAGAWGPPAAGFGEWVRQFIDLEHWAAFGRSFQDLTDHLAAVARGDRGTPPATVTALSGDVHFGYVAEAELGGRSRVRQVVSSPFRQANPPFERGAQRFTMQTPFSLVCRALVGTTPTARPDFGWDITDGPWFDDHLMVLTIAGREAHLVVEVAGLDDRQRPVLRRVHERSL